jgi:hypothetical protein|nr:MAG TPA: carbon storage regulator [Caudoviricetes sp.]DAX85015.1 MAG TPA: carbon storage regulator [Caudoviricetes sp.]
MTKEQLKQPERPVYKKPLFWTTILFGFLSFFLMIMVFVVDSHYVELTNALTNHGLYYDQTKKEIYSKENNQNNTQSSSENGVILTKKLGEKITFEEGSIEVRGMDISDGQVTVAIILENNTDKKSSFNPKEFVAKAGDETLNYIGLQEVSGLTGQGEVKEVSPKSNAVFFLNYNLPKNNSSDFSMQIGKYLWK